MKYTMLIAALLATLSLGACDRPAVVTVPATPVAVPVPVPVPVAPVLPVAPVAPAGPGTGTGTGTATGVAGTVTTAGRSQAPRLNVASSAAISIVYFIRNP